MVDENPVFVWIRDKQFSPTDGGVDSISPSLGVGIGFQCNIGRGVAGEPVGLHLDDWLAKGDEHDKIRRALKWNSLRIRIVESHIEVWLNGKQIVDFTNENPKTYLLKAVSIALQNYGAEAHSGWVKFRNMQLKDLSK